MSMNVNGEDEGSGILNIKADNEGLDSELHLTLNGGIVNIESGNDGINTNEDYVSVTTINGGEVNIYVNGATGEGDGIDSNGWLVINGGTVRTSACAISGDAGIDSDMGIYLNGGTVQAGGNMLDAIAGGEQTYAVFNFAQRVSGGSEIILKDTDGKAVYTCAPENDFSILILAGDFLQPGDYTLWQGETQLAGSTGGNMGGFGGGMMKPEGFDPEDMPEPELPDGMERPEGGFDRKDIITNEDGTITLPDGTTIDPKDMPQRGQEGGMPQPELPEGEMPQMPSPDGSGENRTPGGGRGHGGSGGNMDGTALSPTFTIAEGGNMFSAITAYEEA